MQRSGWMRVFCWNLGVKSVTPGYQILGMYLLSLHSHKFYDLHKNFTRQERFIEYWSMVGQLLLTEISILWPPLPALNVWHSPWDDLSVLTHCFQLLPSILCSAYSHHLLALLHYRNQSCLSLPPSSHHWIPKLLLRCYLIWPFPSHWHRSSLKYSLVFWAISFP